MNLIRFIFYGIIFYFFFKLIKAIFKIFEQKQDKQDARKNMNTNYKKNGHSKIEKKDIIDADFEEIDKE